MKVFLIAGGDLRYITAAEVLAENPGVNVLSVGFDSGVINTGKVKLIHSLTTLGERVDCVLLPIPASRDGIHINTPFYSKAITLSELIPFIKQGGTVFGARFTPETAEQFHNAGIKIHDYSEREDFAVMNAVATAEGAIAIALENSECTLSSRNVLVIGMGRIAKVLLRQLHGFTKNVTAAARKPADIAWAEIYGVKHIYIEELKCSDALSEFDLIINTVPAMILDKKQLRKLKPDALIIDLASAPGGVDFEAAKRLGIKTEWALSLPGKVAPVTSGKVIAETVKNIIKENLSSAE
jgi:dipicolinate synthase subunit A